MPEDTTQTQTRPVLPTGTLTFLFTDIEGSTRLIRSHPTGYAELLERHRLLLRSALAAGVEFGTEGDALFYAFERADIAVAAAAEAQRVLAAEPWPAGAELRIRMGVSTGSADVVGNDYVGIELHRAARICAAAHGGQVLVSATTAVLFRAAGANVRLDDLGEYRLKDFEAPERLFQVRAPGLPAAFPPPRTRQGRTVALPREATPLVGREAELAALQDMALEHRLVTLTGTGGVGKTRLAVALAQNLTPRFRGTVAFVPLAQTASAAGVPSALAGALGRPGAFQGWADVADVIGDEHTLLVLDNAEHLPDLPGHVDWLLDVCRRAHIVITSRSPLGVVGERLYPVEPLDDADAVALLVDRVRARRPAFTPTEEIAADLRRIARRVDCLPLGLELASARLRATSASALAAGLDRQLDLLRDERPDAPERQRTMRAAIEWSHRLLSPADAALFAALAVFAAPARLDVIAHVAGLDHLQALDGLARLIDASLVRLGDEDDPRYGMLEPIRQFAAEQLGDEARATEDRMVEWYARHVGDSLALPGDLAVIRADSANVYRALAYCGRHGDWEQWVGLVYPLAPLLVRRADGPGIITASLAEAASSDLSPRGRARLACVRPLASSRLSPELWQTAAVAARDAGDGEAERLAVLSLANAYLGADRLDDADAALTRADAIPHRSPMDEAFAAALAAGLAEFRDDPDADAKVTAAVDAARATGDAELVSLRLMEQAYALLGRGDAAATLACVHEAQALSPLLYDVMGRYELAYIEAVARLMSGGKEPAAQGMLDSLTASADLPVGGRKIPIPLLTFGAAALLGAKGRDPAAVRLAAFADRHIGVESDTSDRRVMAHLRPYIEAASARLPASELEDIGAAGAHMDAQGAVQLAIDEVSALLATPADGP